MCFLLSALSLSLFLFSPPFKSGRFPYPSTHTKKKKSGKRSLIYVNIIVSFAPPDEIWRLTVYKSLILMFRVFFFFFFFIFFPDFSLSSSSSSWKKKTELNKHQEEIQEEEEEEEIPNSSALSAACYSPHKRGERGGGIDLFEWEGVNEKGGRGGEGRGEGGRTSGHTKKFRWKNQMEKNHDAFNARINNIRQRFSFFSIVLRVKVRIICETTSAISIEFFFFLILCSFLHLSLLWNGEKAIDWKLSPLSLSLSVLSGWRERERERDSRIFFSLSFLILLSISLSRVWDFSSSNERERERDFFFPISYFFFALFHSAALFFFSFLLPFSLRDSEKSNQSSLSPKRRGEGIKQTWEEKKKKKKKNPNSFFFLLFCSTEVCASFCLKNNI